MRNERRRQRYQRRKVEHNTQGLYTMDIVISLSPYAFIYMCRLRPALTTHIGQCHQCNLTVSSNKVDIYVYMTPTGLVYQ